ncbi:MAG: hypothetical protein DMG92_07195 [Acidobacteria bacterium]|nr:MAG: hypothetical protein DMG92_07195 [Acidobacteriota bacterium]
MSTPNSQRIKVEIKPKGRPILVDGIALAGKTFIIGGKFLKTVSLKDEWQEDIGDPEEVIRALKTAPSRLDLLKFCQRLPETEAKYPYYKEWRQVAAIPISTFQYWWDKQIRFRARNKLRKAEKLGVRIEEVRFDDDFIQGVAEIYNQSPIRRGKPFRHYGKDFATIKAELAIDLETAVFIAAYYDRELIGFIKFQIDDRYARITLILDKVVHRDKSPTNGMIAKAIEICAQRRIPYLTYYLWRRGDHGKFQESVGFERFPVPEYYVPLTMLGKIVLALRLHHGWKSMIPEQVFVWLLDLRGNWYAKKLAARSTSPVVKSPVSLSRS